MRLLLDFLEILFVSSSITVLTFLFLAQPLEVTGDSMLPNYHDGEQLIVEKLSKKFEPIVRGEVVIIKHPENPRLFLIKRAIALPGETLLLEDGKIYINGLLLIEPYLLESTQTTGRNFIPEREEIVLESNEYIMLGDNRENSLDSRMWGPLQEENIVGRSFLVYFPLKSFRLAQ